MTSADTLHKAEAALMQSSKELGAMAQDVADAKTVKEFSSDRLKRALSAAVEFFLDLGDGVGISEHKARASQQYGQQLFDLEEQYKAAMRTIEKYDAIKARFEAARSVLSAEKAKVGLI